MRGVRDALIALLLLPLLGDACRGAVAAAPDASARARLGEARTDAVAHAATGALAAAHAAPRGLPHPSSLPPIPGARHLRPPPGRTSGGGAGGAAGAPRVAVPVDPLGNVERLADCLYNQNNLSCIPEYCRPGVVVHGDGVFLPRTSFVGVTWAQDIHREWFQAFSSWRYEPLEVAATPAVKGFTDVYVLFRWTATNTGSYHGQTPSGRPSLDYGVMRVTADKGGLVTDVALRRGGFQEERDALLIDATRTDEISVRPSITDQPFWIPSQSLQLRMVTRAHALLEVLNQGEKFLDALDDLAVPGVELLDGGDMWGPAAAQGLPALKMWLAAWLQGYGGVTAAVTGSAVTQLSNKVFLSFRLLLAPLPEDVRARQQPAHAQAPWWRQCARRLRLLGMPAPQQGASAAAPAAAAAAAAVGSGGSSGGAMSEVEGVLLYVFNLNGFITHLVFWRNGTPEEAADKFIGGRTAPPPGGAPPRSGARRAGGGGGGDGRSVGAAGTGSRWPTAPVATVTALARLWRGVR